MADLFRRIEAVAKKALQEMEEAEEEDVIAFLLAA